MLRFPTHEGSLTAPRPSVPCEISARKVKPSANTNGVGPGEVTIISQLNSLTYIIPILPAPQAYSVSAERSLTSRRWGLPTAVCRFIPGD